MLKRATSRIKSNNVGRDLVCDVHGADAERKIAGVSGDCQCSKIGCSTYASSKVVIAWCAWFNGVPSE